MQITDILSQMGGFQSISRELGVNEEQVTKGAQALIPAIMGGFKKQAESQSGGIAGLTGLLGQLGGTGLLDNVLGPQTTDVSKGNQVLSHIFGSKEISQSVTQTAAVNSGLDVGILQKMLPMLTMLVAGYMAKQGSNVSESAPNSSMLGGLTGLIGGFLGKKNVGDAAGTSGIGALLDMNGDGNPLDDILNMAGKVLR